MNRNDKKDWIASLNSALSSSESAVVAKFNALTVSEMSDLRNEARKLGVSIKVTQNRLTKLALKGTNYEELAPLFKGVTLVAWSEDPISAAKVVYNFAKTNDKLKIKAGVVEGKVLPLEELKVVATLPDKNGMLSMLLSVLQAPIRNMACVIKAVADAQNEE